MSSTAAATGARTRRPRVHAVARSQRTTSSLGRPLAGSPWRRGDLYRLLLWQALGLIVIVICWFFCSGSITWRHQAIWVAISVVASAAAAAGGAVWLLRGFAAVARERRQIRLDIAARYGLGARTETVSDGATDGAADGGYVTADGMARYHLSTCDVVRGKATRRVLDPLAESLRPCGMCQS